MKFLFSLLVLAATISVAYSATVTASSCTLSGDPHFKTFDGKKYDFYGYGTFAILANQYVNIQAQFWRCNTGAVTCTRSLVIKLVDPVNPSTYVVLKWGNFQAMPAWSNSSAYPSTPATPEVNDAYLLQEQFLDGTTNSTSIAWGSFPSAGLVVLNQMYKITYASNVLRIAQLARASDPQEVKDWGNLVAITYTRFYAVAVALPNIPTFTASASKGLCGYFDGNANNDFLLPNGTLTTNVNAWGLAWAVTRSSGTRPLMKHFHSQTLNRVLDSEDDTAIVPDDSQMSKLNEVTFGTTEQVQAAQKFCAELNTNNDQDAYINCVYDVAATINVNPQAAMAIAQSNLVASQAADALTNPSGSSSSGLSDGAKAAIITSCIAAVAIIAVMVLYVRLRSTRRQLSQALVLAQGNHAQGTNSGDIRLQDNL